MTRKTTRKAATVPKQHTVRGEQTRLKIIRTAADLAHRHGFRKTSLEDILAAAEVPKGSLYFYFQSKDDLGRAVIRYRRETLLEALHAIFDPGESLGAQIENWFTFMVSTQQTTGGCFGCPLGNLAQELSREGERFTKEIDLFFTQAQEIVVRCLRRAQHAGEWAVGLSPEEISRFLLVTSQGALLLARVRNSVTPLLEAKKTVLTLLDRFSPEHHTAAY